MAEPREHLSDATLLLYFDGELSGSDQKATKLHIERCWRCRTRLDELQSTVAAIVHGCDSVIDSVPLPTNVTWPGLVPRIAQLERKQPPVPGFLHRHRTGLIAAAILFCAVIFSFSRPAPLSANELLLRTEQAHVVPNRVVYQKLQVRRNVRSTGRTFAGEYELWRTGAYARVVTASLGNELEGRLADVYSANALDWQSPLSGKHLSQWRRGLRAASDSVEDGERVTLTTRAPDASGAVSIQRAQYVVRRSDWHPVGLRLTLADDEIEINELEYSILEPPRISMPAAAATEVIEPGPAEIATAPVAHSAPTELAPAPVFNPLATQMAVLWEIHQLGADLAEPIDVFCCVSGDVVIQAASVPEERRQQLEALAARHLHTRFDTEGSIQRPQAPPGETFPGGAAEWSRTNDGLQERITKYFRTIEAREGFARTLLAGSDSLLTRAYALRKLAESWPARIERTLDPEARPELSAMVRNHTEASQLAVREMHLTLDPLLRSLSKSAPPDPAVQVGTWQDTSRELLWNAQEADSLVRLIFTANDQPATSQAALERLHSVHRHLAKLLDELGSHLQQN